MILLARNLFLVLRSKLPLGENLMKRIFHIALAVVVGIVIARVLEPTVNGVLSTTAKPVTNLTF
jgi:branched-subunit amino acid transport protein